MAETLSSKICFEERGIDYCHGQNAYATARLGRKACAECLVPAFQEQEEKIVSLRAQAERDSLTDLYNVRSFNALLKERVKTGETFGLLMIDLQNFSVVNEREQHIGGNFMLRQTANYLAELLRDDDVGRFGGDEFVVALSPARTHSMSDEDLDKVKVRIKSGFLELPELKSYNQRYKDKPLGIYVGGAIWEKGMTIEDLYRAADPVKENLEE